MDDWTEIKFYHDADSKHAGTLLYNDFERAFRLFKKENKFNSVFSDIHIACMAAVHTQKVTSEMIVRKWQKIGGHDDIVISQLKEILIELEIMTENQLNDEIISDLLKELQLQSRTSIPICEVISMFHDLDDLNRECSSEYFSCNAPKKNYVTDEQLERELLVQRRHWYNNGFKGILFLYIQLNMLIPLFLYGYDTVGNDNVDTAVKVLYIVSDLVMYWFIAMKLTLPCEQNGVWIFDKLEIRFRYLSSRIFWLDLLVAIPLDLIPVSGLFLNPILRFNKLALIFYINDCFGFFSSRVGQVWWRIVNALYWWLYIAHVFACIFPIIAKAAGDEATRVVLFVPNYSTLPISHRYIQALSYSINTLSGLSRGAFPSDDRQAAFALVIVIIGVFVYALVLSVVSYALQVDTQQAQMQAKLEEVRTVLSQEVQSSSLPDDFVEETVAYHKHVYKSMAQLDFREDLLVDLPPSISRSIAISIGKQTIGKVPILKAGHDNDDFVCALQSCLQLIVSPPDFNIIERDDDSSEMYFITSGECEVLGHNDEVIHTLHSGDFFGEIALITRVPRTATIRTKTFCNLLELRFEDYESVLSRFPGMTASIKEHAKERIRKIRTSMIKQKEHPSLSTLNSTSPTNASSEDEFDWIRHNSYVSRRSNNSGQTTYSQSSTLSESSQQQQQPMPSLPSFKRTKRKQQVVVQIDPPEDKPPPALRRNSRHQSGMLSVNFAEDPPQTSPTGSILGLIDGSNRRCSKIKIPEISLPTERSNAAPPPQDSTHDNQTGSSQTVVESCEDGDTTLESPKSPPVP